MNPLQAGHLHRAFGNRFSGEVQWGQIASLDPNAGNRGVANDLIAGRWLMHTARVVNHADQQDYALFDKLVQRDKAIKPAPPKPIRPKPIPR